MRDPKWKTQGGGCLWDTCGIPVGYPWDTCRIPQFFGKPQIRSALLPSGSCCSAALLGVHKSRGGCGACHVKGPKQLAVLEDRPHLVADQQPWRVSTHSSGVSHLCNGLHQLITYNNDSGVPLSMINQQLFSIINHFLSGVPLQVGQPGS